MPRMRKHIARPHPRKLVAGPLALGAEDLKVPGERRRVAAHVHHAVRRESADRVKERGLAALPRGIDDDDVGADEGCMFIKIPALRHVLRRGGEEVGVGKAVAGGIFLRVENRLGHDLDPVDVLRMRR